MSCISNFNIYSKNDSKDTILIFMIFTLAVKFLPHNDCAIEMAEKINTFNMERILYILFVKLARSDLFQRDTLLYTIIMYITRQKC